MPPKKKTASTEGEAAAPKFTDSEATMIEAIFTCMNTRPDVDFDEVAKFLGLAKAKYAKNRFRTMAKKHGWSSMDGSGAAAPTNGALAPKNPGKVAKKPAVKKKGTAQKKKTARKDQESDEDEEISAKLESDSDGKFKDDEMSEESEEAE
ncbi:hypothetical protein CCHL11_01482 [Colletotrichum chlorophyti]|uniref:Uncharacterized protein n=1 Tax=Colletotrichum chlorophyti TaxID=708187 RepID=A0A1Q8RXY6_9PEZI|nr:hypothetical protein CCHL11_01482 [Colletotrichum chlorophyti]